jgi:hypothetical protein
MVKRWCITDQSKSHNYDWSRHRVTRTGSSEVPVYQRWSSKCQVDLGWRSCSWIYICEFLRPLQILALRQASSSAHNLSFQRRLHRLGLARGTICELSGWILWHWWFLFSPMSWTTFVVFPSHFHITWIHLAQKWGKNQSQRCQAKINRLPVKEYSWIQCICSPFGKPQNHYFQLGLTYASSGICTRTSC